MPKPLEMCAFCRFYRVKGEDGDGKPSGMVGVCDNLEANAAVNFEIHGNPSAIPRSERPFRRFKTRGDFGCLYWSGAGNLRKLI